MEVARFGDEFTLDVGLPPVITLEDPFETTGDSVEIFPGASQQGDARSIIFAPYLVDRIALGSKVQAVLGARLDVLDFEEPLLGTDRHDTQVSPMAGLTFTPRPSVTVYAQAGASFAPPSSLVVGERAPERSRQIEAGLKAQILGGKGFVTLSGYHLERNDIAIPDATGVTRQNGDQRSQGFEVELSAEPTPSWFAAASYALTDAELTRYSEIVGNPLDPTSFAVLDRSGNVPAFAPRHTFALWTVKRFGAASIGGGARYVSEQFIAEDNAFRLDSSFEVNATLFYDLADWRLNLHLKNLTDEDYFTRGFGRSSVIPADPFAVYATLGVSFGR